MKRPKLAERPIQRATVHLLGAQRCWAIHVPNGAHLAGDKLARIKQVVALKKDGTSPGFPDLVVIDQRVAGRVGFIECKREGVTKLDPDQVTWRDDIIAAGLPWALVNDPQGGMDALRAWGWR